MALLNVFWIMIYVSVIVSVIGLVFQKSYLLYIAAVPMLPLALYLAATPLFRYWGLIFPFLYVGSAVLVQRKKRILAVVLSVPAYLLVGWLMYTVWNQ